LLSPWSLFLFDPDKSSPQLVILTDRLIQFDDGRSDAGAEQTAGVKPTREFRQSRVTLTPHPRLTKSGEKKSQQSPAHDEHGGSGGDFGAATALGHDR